MILKKLNPLEMLGDNSRDCVTNKLCVTGQWRAEEWEVGFQTPPPPPEIPKAVQNRAKLNPIENC